MLDKIQSFYGFSRMPFGRDLAPDQLYRHRGHAETVARLTWAIAARAVAVLTDSSHSLTSPPPVNGHLNAPPHTPGHGR
jgi:type II secretory pathway predicted ATPase ExeA